MAVEYDGGGVWGLDSGLFWGMAIVMSLKFERLLIH